MILVSACLAGCRCRYNGGACADARVLDLVNKGEALPLCPEQLGGRPTPRPSSEIVSKQDGTYTVLNSDGTDQTEAFQLGAERTLAVCKALGITQAILKANSPSCGSGVIYDGTFSGNRIKGDGVTARLLKENGISVQTEELIEPSPIQGT